MDRYTLYTDTKRTERIDGFLGNVLVTFEPRNVANFEKFEICGNGERPKENIQYLKTASKEECENLVKSYIMMNDYTKFLRENDLQKLEIVYMQFLHANDIERRNILERYKIELS